MKRYALMFGFFISLTCLASSESPNIGRFAEYHIKPNDMLTFSNSGAKVRLCDDCPVATLTLAADIALYEQESIIDIKRATELYLSPAYNVIFIGVDRQEKQITDIRFGGFSGPY